VAHAEAFFLPTSRGSRFCLLHAPRDANRRAILFVPPFAEEMNRSRRMAALQARAFADVGRPVLQVDLFGCGDSEGDFGDAAWSRWIRDVVEAAQWLSDRCGAAPTLWGLRAGCLLASAAAREMGGSSDFLFWQPVVSGKQHLRQFLRIGLAGRMMNGDPAEAATLAHLQARLSRGEPVEIAGYELSPTLAVGMEAAELTLPETAGRVAWMEIAGDVGAGLPDATQRMLSGWRSRSVEVIDRAVAGAPFWQMLEPTEVPALVEATMDATAAWA
jgi:uncharacterized protein